MKIRPAAFNIYLLVLLLFAGCKSPQEKRDDATAKRQKKELTAIEFHLEAQGDTTGRAEQVPILRAAPIMVNVIKDPFLDERDLVGATLVDSVGGFFIRIQFNEHGTLVLDGITSGNKGKRIAIMADFTERRWLAAPVISKRITDGVLLFTPDATKEEAQRIVRGLNNTIKKLHKKSLVPGL